MCDIVDKSRWRARAVGWFSGLGLFLSVAIACGQPASAPPERITLDVAAEKLGGPTLITLSLQDAAPSAVFEALAEQSGISFDDYEARDHLSKLGNMSVEYQAEPIWPVLRELTSKLNVAIRPYDHPRFDGHNAGVVFRIQPNDDPDLRGLVCERGPFLVIASRVGRSTSLAPSPPSSGGQRVVMEFIVLVDPKIRTRGEPDGFDLEIVDDQGRALEIEKPRTANWTREVVSHSPLIWKVNAWAQLADVKVNKLKRVSGVLRFITTTRSQPWTVTNILQPENTAKDIDDTSFVVRSVTPCEYAGPAFAVTLASWGRGETPDFGWPPRSMYDRVSAVRLLDASGNQLHPYHWQEQENRDLLIVFKSASDDPDNHGDPETLIWELPTEVAMIQVPFEFSDVPLP